MNGYLINFLIYTMAMVGIMLISVLIYKKTSLCKAFSSGKKSSMTIEESLSLSPKKTLYVISVKGEKFLIASDSERTSFLAKLDKDIPTRKMIKQETVKEYVKKAEPLPERGIIPGINPTEIKRAAAQKKSLSQTSFSQTLKNEAEQKVMRNLAGKIRLKRGI